MQVVESDFVSGEPVAGSAGVHAYGNEMVGKVFVSTGGQSVASIVWGDAIAVAEVGGKVRGSRLMGNLIVLVA